MLDLDRFYRKLTPVEASFVESDITDLASVLVAITHSNSPEVILTKRAEHMSSHSGQVAFPGGRVEPEDGSLIETALRESHEEIALLPELVSIKGQLPERPSVNGIRVYPHVGLVPSELTLTANPEEIAAIFKVPLAFFLEVEPDRTRVRMRNGQKLVMPTWFFEDYEIWGLTALILNDMIGLIDPTRNK